MNDAKKWLKNLVGDRYVEPKEESRAMESYYYGNPEDVYARNQGRERARDRKLKKGGGNGHK